MSDGDSRGDAVERSVVEQLTELVVRWRPDGTRTYVNRALCELVGRAREELLGTGDWGVLPGDGWWAMLGSAALLSPDQPTLTIERLVARRDGAHIWHEWIDRGLFDEQGRLVEVQSVGRDVSERRRAVEAERQERLLVEVLRDTSLALNSTLDTASLYERILAAAAWVIPHDAAAIMLVAGSTARVAQVRGWDPRRMGLRPLKLHLREVDRDLLRGMAVSGRATVVRDTGDRSLWAAGAPVPGFDWVGAFAAAPLFDEGRIVGVLVLMCEQPQDFRQVHVELIEGFASQAASAARNARLFEEANRGRAELRRLSERLVSAQEEERRRISRELHDEVGQSLTGVIMNADFILGELRGECSDFIAARLRDISGLAKSTLDQIRGLSLRLRPTMLDELGLESTLRWLVDAYSERSGIRVSLESRDVDGERLPEAVTTALYRCVQEALTNAARHAAPEEIAVQLSRDGDVIRLSVSDDGRGFDPAELGVPRLIGGTGITGMRERLASVGGEMAVFSSPGNGTLLVVEVPCRALGVAAASD